MISFIGRSNLNVIIPSLTLVKTFVENEFDEIAIQNLIPEHLRQGSVADFLSRLNEFDVKFQEINRNQEPNHVLRYVGDLHGNLS